MHPLKKLNTTYVLDEIHLPLADAVPVEQDPIRVAVVGLLVVLQRVLEPNSQAAGQFLCLGARSLPDAGGVEASDGLVRGSDESSDAGTRGGGGGHVPNGGGGHVPNG